MTVLSQPRSKPAWLKEGAPQGALFLWRAPRAFREARQAPRKRFTKRETLPLQYGAPEALRRGVAAPPNNLSQREGVMKFIVWLIRVLVFVLLLVLALANTQSATLNFLAGYNWQAPLILIGLAFFGVGLIAGLLSALPAIFRMRMENGRLKRDLRAVRENPAVVDQPPMPPVI
ncbi:hypothetical protein BPC006_I2981 [Burkholderia pseudomallei BPC006]|uniref:Lipopolysaccharide assembly protein A domain-containing protein n=9 Tax=pseudomallei group TaxID=111527 RepID=A0A0E1W394_BURPE|nr:conserved hypothetical protein [Burkholderia pseudomallei MSHR346]AFR16834.1 hypothetical protein BPC006_I2981 [Burkholderia pseudomallei BPC006]EDO95594.1 conserved hypothetical protein [Burkholderia pseudomallei Pasteur 52237]EDS85108.1 conserved hypothetical protein [Burkholderia pseudomallei S13]EET07608.1 conserved hypothetical protein [Burkholderia pseudomallei 1710a]